MVSGRYLSTQSLESIEVTRMEMTKCILCGKVFGSAGKKACSSCRKEMDTLYEKARNYLRDHPKEELDAQKLAVVMDVDPQWIRLLIEEGRFVKDHPADDSKEGLKDDSAELSDERKKQRLLEEFQKTVTKPSGTAEKQSSEDQSSSQAMKYGRERHSR